MVRSNTNVVFLVQQLQEKHLAKNKTLHLAFLNLNDVSSIPVASGHCKFGALQHFRLEHASTCS